MASKGLEAAGLYDSWAEEMTSVGDRASRSQLHKRRLFLPPIGYKQPESTHPTWEEPWHPRPRTCASTSKGLITQPVHRICSLPPGAAVPLRASWSTGETAD